MQRQQHRHSVNFGTNAACEDYELLKASAADDRFSCLGPPIRAQLRTDQAEGCRPQSRGEAWYSALMSKAFTKEADPGEVYDDLPDRPVSPHNLVTRKGLEMIEAELARLHRE